MSPDSENESKPVRIIYTGTRAPGIELESVDILHLPMLASERVSFNPQIISELLKVSVQVVFFSSRAVDAIADSPLESYFKSEHLETWAVGRKTAARVEEKLGSSARVPARQDFQGLCAELQHDDTRKIVVFGLEDAPRDLGEALEDRIVHEFPVYRTFPRLYPDLGRVLREFDGDWIAFTSSRGVEAFATQADQFDFPWRSLQMAAIGPSTGDTLRDHKLDVRVQLEEPGRNRLVTAIVETG